MDAYITTLFGGDAWDLCYKLGRGVKHTHTHTQDPTLNPSPLSIPAYNNQDPTLIIFNHI